MTPNSKQNRRFEEWRKGYDTFCEKVLKIAQQPIPEMESIQAEVTKDFALIKQKDARGEYGEGEIRKRRIAEAIMYGPLQKERNDPKYDDLSERIDMAYAATLRPTEREVAKQIIEPIAEMDEGDLAFILRGKKEVGLLDNVEEFGDGFGEIVEQDYTISSSILLENNLTFNDLKEALKHPRIETAKRAVELLGGLQYAEVVTPLLRMLESHDMDYGLRCIIARNIGKIGNGGTSKVLLALLNDTELKKEGKRVLDFSNLRFMVYCIKEIMILLIRQ